VRDELRRMALFGSGMVELTKARAEQIAKDLVKEGEVRRKQAKSVVKDLMEASRANRQELGSFVRTEMRSQIESLGLATKRDLERIERRVTRLETNLKESSAPRKKTAAKKSTVAKSGTAKSSARKATTRKTTTRKTAARKSTARKPTVAPTHSPSPVIPPTQPPGSAG
jgi:polyhydroxyalkanoate synthesis regulator phasin